MSDTQSLSTLLQALLIQRGGTRDTSAVPKGHHVGAQLAFVGNWQDPCPRLLLLDPQLEPVDIVTWQVIRVHAEPGQLVAFPTYPDLMQWVRVSRATVARAVTVLRLARWLPLCASVRDPRGRFVGNVYALQDEPLPLAEALRADEGYVKFAQQTRTHRNAHVRKTANEICQSLHQDAMALDTHVLEPTDITDHLAARFARMMDLYQRGSEARVQDLNAVKRSGTTEPAVQDLNAETRVQNLNSDGSSSKNIKTTTTHTAAHTTSKSPRSMDGETPLTFPAELTLTDSQQRVLAQRFEHLSEPLRQDVLDEATARILTKRRTADPVRCEFDYIARVVARALVGEFVLTDVGERWRERQAAHAESVQRLARARACSEVRRKQEVVAFQVRKRAISPDGQ